MTPTRSWLVEALGMVLGPALFFRAFVHVMTAAYADLDPSLSDGTDVQLSSPVPSLRDTVLELQAGLVSTALAMVLAFGFRPVAGYGLAGAWLTANWLVLVCDPIAPALHRLRTRYRQQSVITT